MNKMLAARPIFRSIIQSKAAPLQRLYHADGHGEHRPASYNDLPQPEGNWEDNYRKKQTKYNAFLGGSILALVGTIVYINVSGVIFFNAFPPDTYE